MFRPLPESVNVFQIRKLSRTWVLLAAALIGGACELDSAAMTATTPRPLSVGQPAPRYADVSLAVVISDSFRKADQFTAGWGQAGTLANGINSILGSRFKKVVEAISLEAAKEKGTDLVAYLDGRVTYSMGILDTGTADVSARFTDLEGRTLETVSGKGIDKRFAGPVLPAAEAAVADFARNLDNASRLLAEAERISESARSTTADAPTPAAADRVRFPRTPLGVTFPKRNVRPDDVAVIVGNADYGKLGKTSPTWCRPTPTLPASSAT